MLNFKVLHEICPNATNVEIDRALSLSNGDVDEAAQQLLGQYFKLGMEHYVKVIIKLLVPVIQRMNSPFVG